MSEHAGTNVSISNLEKKYPKRKKKETALTKHRKWLAELQNTKDRLENQYEDEIRATQAKNEKVDITALYSLLYMRNVTNASYQSIAPQTIYL